MQSVKDDTIGGFNAFIGEQKAVPGTAELTLVQFDDLYEVVYAVKNIQEAPVLTSQTFTPRGSTALLDAIGRTINSIGERLANMPEDDRPGQVVVVILTDGQENASREFTSSQVFSMISHQRDKYQWQIAFIGANQDSIATAASYGIPASNALNYAATAAGTQQAFRRMNEAISSKRRDKSGKTDDFFAPEGTENAVPAAKQ